jgi:hypothetical protein
MVAMKLSRIAILGSVGLAGWVGGTLSERYKFSSLLHVQPPNNVIQSKPGLPIFSTVSAASPIIPSQSTIQPGGPPGKVSRVSEV